MRTVLTLVLLALASLTLALGGNPNVRFSQSRGAFPLIRGGQPARVRVEADDWPGVARAAHDLQQDLARVSDWKGELGPRAPIVLVGTLGKSHSIDALVKAGKLDVSSIRGKWEASVTQVLDQNTLVVAGSDKRGTIYGLYDLSEATGVSPWNWWADVPVKRHKEAYVVGRYVAKSPVVRYRGIFLNDEAPALSNWVYANFGNYNHKFYERVFELLLRLRANYLWPAMWNNCFSEDDPLNPKLADEYGIVMGTSHVEPMMRADKEWNRLGFTERQWNYGTNPKELEEFWRAGVLRNKPYENVVTIAMRGKVDTPMSETANIALLEKIVGAQRRILAETVDPDVTRIPQLWCLYKEVQEYYEKGMRVPDDVTLLWADDNWGDIRRLPTPEERKRAGGAGVYYHFDYVGGPRNYKWLDTNPLPKIWEQMNLAHRYGADRIWIVNVGDLKPMELPMEFFLTMARDPEAIRKEDLPHYAERWAAREFGPKWATEIADIVMTTRRLNGRRKPELVNADTYSLLDYDEFGRVVSEYDSLLEHAEHVAKALPAEYQPAFFQLVTHPAKAMANLYRMYFAQATNALFAKWGHAATNDAADTVARLFARDAEITKEYHALNGGKWNHFMDQTHISYTYWQQPDKDVMPAVRRIEIPQAASMAVAVPGSDQAYPGGSGTPTLAFSPYGDSSKGILIFNRGRDPFAYAAKASAAWIRLANPTGRVSPHEGLSVSIDWSKAPMGRSQGTIEIRGAGRVQNVLVVADKPSIAPVGFVESDGVVAIEAEHTARRVAAAGVKWETIPGYGRTLSGVAPFPVEFRPFDPGKGARLEYDVTTFFEGRANLEAIVSPSLAFQPGHGLRVAFAFDGESPQVVDIAPSYLSRQWETAVSDAVQKVRTQHTLHAGHHTLKVWAIDPGVVIQRLHLDLGGMKPSYLGPPESWLTTSRKEIRP